jgi:hypothetical protein
LCGAGTLRREPLAGACVVLARTRVHRSRPASLFQAPYDVVHVREEFDPPREEGAAFNCPLMPGSDAVEIGERIELRTLRWRLEDGSTFEGVVAARDGA